MAKQKFTVIVTLEFIDGVLSGGSTDAPQTAPEAPKSADVPSEAIAPIIAPQPTATLLNAAVEQMVNTIVEDRKAPVCVPAQTPKNVGGAGETTPAEVPTTDAPRERKKREKKTNVQTVVLDSPGQQPVKIHDVGTPKIVDAVTPPVSALADIAEKSVNDDIVAEPVEPPEPPKSTIVGLPTPEQKKLYNERYAKFTTNPGGILHEAGMVPSEGVGGIYRKLRAFAMLKFPHIADLKDMTAAEWERFLTYMENVVATENGPATLVAVINREIGVSA